MNSRIKSKPERYCFLCLLTILMMAGYLLLPIQSLRAQITTGKLSGSYKERHDGIWSVNHFRGYMVMLDLSSHDFIPVVSNRAKGCDNSKASPLEPLYSWSARDHVFLSLNGNFIEPEKEYKPGDCQPIIGPLKSNGKVIVGLSSRPDGRGNPALWFDRGNNPQISMIDSQMLKKAANVISGQWRPHADLPVNGSLLINNGIIKADSSLPVPYEAAPRTAAGITKDCHILILIMIEGRMPDVQGISLPALAGILKSYGAWNAVNFDGGGSSTIEYIPSPDWSVKESARLYNLIRNAASFGATGDSLTFTFRQLDPRLPFASTAVNRVDSGGDIHNQLYRPLNVFWGFRIRN